MAESKVTSASFFGCQPLAESISRHSSTTARKMACRSRATYLLQLVASRGWTCTALFQISHYATSALHIVALLETGHFICDCMMVTNLGLPCRHFYAVLRMPSSPRIFIWVSSIEGMYSQIYFYCSRAHRSSRPDGSLIPNLISHRRRL